MYDVVDLFDKMFNVNKYRERVVEVIDDILLRGKTPVVVGGTNYYIEAILYLNE
jgi:tRNA dimethylallyltransferase